MRRPTIIPLCIIALGGAIGFVLSCLGPQEPIWQGRPLSQWLTECKSDHPRDLSESAQKAIQAMGTNALPHLLRMVAWKESSAKRRLRAWFGRGSVVRRWIPTRPREQERGAAGFEALGKVAAPAVPQLIQLLGDDVITSYHAALALSAIGSPAIPALVQTLTNESAWARMGAVQALNFMHGAEEAIPDLLKRLDDPEPAVRGGAAIALGDMRRQSQTVVPKLIVSLSDTNGSVRATAARALGSFGVEAHAAVPKLIGLQEDPNAEVRKEASAALKKVSE